MRERLIELIESVRYWGSGTSAEIADRLLANGVIVPPVKAGQTVWFPSQYYGAPYPITITHLEIYEEETVIYSEGGSEWRDEDIGKTVFLTREEAEKALKEAEG